MFNTQNNTPLANLYVTSLQELAGEADKFASSTDAVSELKQS